MKNLGNNWCKLRLKEIKFTSKGRRDNIHNMLYYSSEKINSVIIICMHCITIQHVLMKGTIGNRLTHVA